MSATDPFFVVGTGRSGTTLVQRMLSAHLGLAVPPETQFFSRFDPAIRFSDPLQGIDADAYLRTIESDPWLAQLPLDAGDFRGAIDGGARSSRDLFLWMLGALAGDIGPGVRLGEKTPHHEKHVGRLAQLFPGAVFIHVTRDPRDVVVSLRIEEWWPWSSVQRTALAVRKTLERQREHERVLGGRFVRLRYEDVVQHPERELTRVCHALGIEFDPAMLDYHEQSDSGYLPGEEEWKSLTGKPLDPSRIGRWRSRLSTREAQAVERACGTIMRTYGYEPEMPRSAFGPLADGCERVWWFLSRQGRSLRKRVRPSGA